MKCLDYFSDKKPISAAARVLISGTNNGVLNLHHSLYLDYGESISLIGLPGITVVSLCWEWLVHLHSGFQYSTFLHEEISVGIFTEQMCIKIWHYSLIGEASLLWHASAAQCILHSHCQPWQQTPFFSSSSLRIKKKNHKCCCGGILR